MTVDELRQQLALLKDGSRPICISVYEGIVELKGILFTSAEYVAEHGYLIAGELLDHDDDL